MLAHPNSGLSSTRQIGIGVCAKIEIIATAAKIPAMTATAMMIFLFIDVLFLTFPPLIHALCNRNETHLSSFYARQCQKLFI